MLLRHGDGDHSTVVMVMNDATNNLIIPCCALLRPFSLTIRSCRHHPLFLYTHTLIDLSNIFAQETLATGSDSSSPPVTASRVLYPAKLRSRNP
jgi:hypothetical protein